MLGEVASGQQDSCSCCWDWGNFHFQSRFENQSKDKCGDGQNKYIFIYLSNMHIEIMRGRRKARLGARLEQKLKARKESDLQAGTRYQNRWELIQFANARLKHTLQSKWHLLFHWIGQVIEMAKNKTTIEWLFECQLFEFV